MELLLVRPGADVDWQPEGPLHVQLRFHPAGSTVSVETESPTPPDLSEVTNLLVLTTAAVSRVEDRPQVRAHVASRPRTDLPALPPLRAPGFGRGWLLAGLVGLTVGAGVWGCWFTLERRPPCLKDTQAEYKGKCYLPGSKDRDRGGKPAQSVDP